MGRRVENGGAGFSEQLGKLALQHPSHSFRLVRTMVFVLWQLYLMKKQRSPKLKALGRFLLQSGASHKASMTMAPQCPIPL